MGQPFVKQLRTGKVKEMGREIKKSTNCRWQSAIFKSERKGPVMLYKTGLEADEVADTKVHGGPEKALFRLPSPTLFILATRIRN